MMTTRRTQALAIAVVAAAALAGCGGSSDNSSDSGTSAAPAPSAPKGSVRFLAPNKDAKTGSTVSAKVALKNFQINARTVGQAPRPGQGHLHFKLDEGKFDYPKYSGKNGFLGKKLGVNGTYSPALTPAITYSHLPPGKHELEVYLANNNHTNVGVEAKVEFTVK
jgi:hypothetical protein